MRARGTRLLVATVTVVGCSVIGYLLGRLGGIEPEVDPAVDRHSSEAAVQHTNDPEPADMTRPEGALAIGEPHKIAPHTTDGLIARIHEVLAIEDYDERRYHKEVMFDNMTAEQAPEVFAALQELPRSDDTGQMMIFFFSSWGQVDGTAAVQAAREIEGRQRAMYTAMALRGWGESDPKAAWATASEIADGWPAMASRIGSIITNLAEQDLPAAIAARKDLIGPFQANLAQRGVISFAADAGAFNAVFDEVMQFDSVEDQKSWLHPLFARWSNQDANAALVALENIADPAIADYAMTGFLASWTRSDPEAALDYTLAHTEDWAARRALPSAVLSTLSTADHQTTTAVVERLSASGHFDLAVRPVLPALATSNPELAIDLAGKLSDDQQRQMSTAMVIGRWAQSDFDAATARFEQLPDNESKQGAIQQMAFQALTREDGGERIARWVNAIPAGRGRTSIVERLLGMADSPRQTVSDNAKQALQELVAQTPELSEQGRAHAVKLFGAEAAPTAQP